MINIIVRIYNTFKTLLSFNVHTFDSKIYIHIWLSSVVSTTGKNDNKCSYYWCLFNVTLLTVNKIFIYSLWNCWVVMVTEASFVLLNDWRGFLYSDESDLLVILCTCWACWIYNIYVTSHIISWNVTNNGVKLLFKINILEFILKFINFNWIT